MNEDDYILAVEDDEHMRDFIVGVLSEYNVLAVDCGTAAFAEIERKRPQLVVLDLILPGMSGNEIAKILTRSAIPYIITSASTNWDLILQAISHGAISFVAKPFSPLQLSAAVAAAVQRQIATPPQQQNAQHDILIACGVISERFNVSEFDSLNLLESSAASKKKSLSELAKDILAAQQQFIRLMQKEE